MLKNQLRKKLTIKDKCANSWEQKRLSKSPTDKPRENCLKPDHPEILRGKNRILVAVKK